MIESFMSITQIDCSQATVASFPITIVVSRFNTPITNRLLDSALSRLKACQFKDEDIQVIHVPGAVEIPLVCRRVAANGRARAIIALGAVIRGETSHYDYVCDYVTKGCLSVSEAFELPLIFGVLTTENGEQAYARTGGEHSDKGQESVDAAIEMVQVIEKLENVN
jgi:6,7-dimethyl-8-ribityllumazine synthase